LTVTAATWEAHKANFQTMLDAAEDHRRFCLGRARNPADGTEAAVLMVLNHDGDEILMVPVARMIDDPEEFMGRFTMDPEAT